jgi:hypothetical protein
MQKDGLVSFWVNENSTDSADFVGSGFFLTPEWVVTAKHVLKRACALRPQAAATQAILIDKSACVLHDTLDVAIIQLGHAPAGVKPLPVVALNEAPRVEGLPALELWGYRAGVLEHNLSGSVASFDSSKSFYVLDFKQPQGHSGSALVLHGRVWGLTFQHFVDPNIHRGGALALHQVRDWLCLHITALKSPCSGEDWERFAKDKFRAILLHPIVQKQAEAVTGLVPSLTAVLEQPITTLGFSLVDKLKELLAQVEEQMRVERLKLVGEEKKLAKEKWLELLGVASQLCVSPSYLACSHIGSNSLVERLIRVKASSPASAALATGLDRSLGWSVETDPGASIPEISDAYAHSIDLEFGDGGSLRDGLGVLLHKKLFPLADKGEKLDTKTRHKLRAYLAQQAKSGLVHILVAKADALGEQAADLEAALEEVRLDALLLDDCEEGSHFYLCDEYDLLAGLAAFIQSIDAPIWTTP